MTTPPICPYCNEQSQLVKGKQIYPHRRDLWDLNFYHCANNHAAAYVGCHKTGDGKKPLGRLADDKLRAAKSAAHAAFDPLWKKDQIAHFPHRAKAYKWLAEMLGVDGKDCHIGMFDVAQCERVVSVCEQLKTEIQAA